jgi:hypothetical protein
VPVAGELDWLGFVVDDLAHRRARAPEVTRCVRLAAGGGAGAWVVTTRRRFDEGGDVREVRSGSEVGQQVVNMGRGRYLTHE